MTMAFGVWAAARGRCSAGLLPAATVAEAEWWDGTSSPCCDWYASNRTGANITATRLLHSSFALTDFYIQLISLSYTAAENTYKNKRNKKQANEQSTTSDIHNFQLTCQLVINCSGESMPEYSQILLYKPGHNSEYIILYFTGVLVSTG